MKALRDGMTLALLSRPEQKLGSSMALTRIVRPRWKPSPTRNGSLVEFADTGRTRGTDFDSGVPTLLNDSAPLKLTSAVESRTAHTLLSIDAHQDRARDRCRGNIDSHQRTLF
jgi:hypothetical protein